MFYEFCQWQVIDTPGILDHPLEDRNTIEMTAITALAHIPATILFFLDISEQCGTTIKQQSDLFHSIKALFKNKPLLVVLNKIDVRPVGDLSEEEMQLIKAMTEGIQDADAFPTSCATQEGVDAVRKRACDLLLARRVEAKVTQHKADTMANRIHVTHTQANPNRPPCIPPSVFKEKEMKEAGEEVPRRRTEKDLQEEMGGAGVWFSDDRKNFFLDVADWKYDIAPELMDGRNVSDFIDEDIMARLEELEKEEDLLLAAEGLKDTNEVLEKWKVTQSQLDDVHSRINQKKTENRVRVARNRMGQGGTDRRAMKKLTDVVEALENRGVDVNESSLRARSKGRKRLRDNDTSIARDGSLISAKKHILRATGDRSKARSKSRLELGLSKPEDRATGEFKKRKITRRLSKHGKKGEADHWIPDWKPKHLHSGKRKIGKTDRR